MADKHSRTAAGLRQVALARGRGARRRVRKELSGVETAGRPHASPSDPPGDARHDARRRDRSRGRGIETPAFDALAARGRRFRQAYATVPETLPFARLDDDGALSRGSRRPRERPLPFRGSPGRGRAAPAGRLPHGRFRLRLYAGAALRARARDSTSTTTSLPEGTRRASAPARRRTAPSRICARSRAQPLFLWVHYYDPHYPYAPPEPFRSRYATDPTSARSRRWTSSSAASSGLRGAEQEQGARRHRRRRRPRRGAGRPRRITAREPPVPGDDARPAAARRARRRGGRERHAGQHAKGLPHDPGLGGPRRTRTASGRAEEEIVLAEAMKPFSRIRVAAAGDGASRARRKAILAGRLEVYDVAADPREERDLAARGEVPRPLRPPFEDIRSPRSNRSRPAGRLGGEEAPQAREPRLHQRDAAPVGPQERAAARGHEPPLRRHRARRPASSFARSTRRPFRCSRGSRPRIPETSTPPSAWRPRTRPSGTKSRPSRRSRRPWRSHPIHRTSGPISRCTTRAASSGSGPRLSSSGSSPKRRIAFPRSRRWRCPRAAGTNRRRRWRCARRSTACARPLRGSSSGWVKLAMGAGQTAIAIESFERARAVQGARLRARSRARRPVIWRAGRFAEAREALDRVPPSHPDYPMALFKRAQVSVLLHEPDQAARIALARERADSTTRRLIAAERLFQNADTR